MDASIVTFRTYVCSRKYDYGRGTVEAWRFLSVAVGRVEYLAVDSMAELEGFLVRDDAGQDLVRGARSVWKSYMHWRWRQGGQRQPAHRGEARAGRA